MIFTTNNGALSEGGKKNEESRIIPRDYRCNNIKEKKKSAKWHDESVLFLATWRTGALLAFK